MVTLQTVLLSILSLSLASYVPKKSLEKPGICPKIIGGIAGNCISDCSNDYECPGDKKCCRINKCATSCTMPIFSDTGSLRSSVILDDTNTVFGVQSGLSGIRKSGLGIRADNVESSRRFTGGKTSTTFNTGVKGKSISLVSTQSGRSGFDDIGFTQDFGRNDGAISGRRSGLRGRGSVSGKFESFDGGLGHGKDDGGFIGSRKGSVIKSSGGRIGSVVDTFDLQRESGFGSISGSHGASLLRKLNGGTIDKRIGLLEDNMGRNIIRTSQGGEFGNRRSSFQTSSRLDGISGRSSGLTGSQTGIAQGGSKKICRKQCKFDGDCRGGKICVINGCHQYCRRGPVKNNYQP